MLPLVNDFRLTGCAENTVTVPNFKGPGHSLGSPPSGSILNNCTHSRARGLSSAGFFCFLFLCDRFSPGQFSCLYLCRFACTDLLYILHLLKYLPGYPLHSEVRLVVDWFCYKIKYGHYKQNKICSVYTFKFASTAHVWIVLLKVPMPHFVLFFLTWINSWQSKFFFRLCLCSDFFGDIFYRIFLGFLTSWDTFLFAQSVDSPQFHVKVFDASSVKDFVSKVIEQNRTVFY